MLPPPLGRSSRRSRNRTAWQRGQSLIIFALSTTVLLGLAGLSIDVMRAYDLYSRELRAAEAGALAGVIYMPCLYNTTAPLSTCGVGSSPDGKTAVTRAMIEVQKNGFGASVTPPTACVDTDTSAEVTVCKVSTSGTALRVTITEPINVFLLSMVGVATFNVTASAAADYLQPFVLGAVPPAVDSNLWGDSNLHNPQFFDASFNGPGEFQEMGDPYVFCQDGSSQGPPADINMLNATALLTNTVTGSAAGFTTNHAAYTTGSVCGSANPDKQPTGFEGEATRNTAHPGAYNYAITIPQGGAGYSVWVNNPGDTPSDPATNSCNGLATLDIYYQDNNCANYYTQYGPLAYDGSHFDDPRFTFNVTYSLYGLASPFFPDPGPPGLVTGTPVTYPPLDQIGADLTAHGCSTAYNYSQVSTYTSAATATAIPAGVGCVASTDPAYTAGKWTQIGGTIAGGASAPALYRLAIEATPYYPNANNPACPQAYQCGWGRHSYALAVCANGTTPTSGCTAGATLSPWNNMSLYLNFPSAQKDVYVPLAYVPPAYAGRTITFSLFDPGDSHGHGDNEYMMIVPPDSCITVTYPTPNATYPNWVRQVKYPGTISPALTGACTNSQAATNSVYTARRNGANNVSDDIYNGLWVTGTIQLPSTFTGGNFWLDAHSDQGKNFDQMAVSFQVNGGSPVHLIS